jgi:hypothetical protein
MRRIVLIVALALMVGAAALLARNVVAPQASTSVSFAKAITLESPLLYPSSLAAGELDHSGIPGLAVVSEENTSPLVYSLGRGNGYFRGWRRNDNVGYAPGFVLLAAVDGSPNLDAITTDAGAGDINLAFGDGKGHLYGGERLLIGDADSTYMVAVADVNGDGIPDIVGTDDSGIFVVLGEGSRKFSDALMFGSGGQDPYCVAVGDLNHDGIPDLVVANTFSARGYGNVAVLLGKGDGTFDQPVTYKAGIRPWQLVLGDFNNDGNLDLAVVPIGGGARARFSF